MSEAGKSITQSTEFLARVYAECNHLSKLLKQELSALLLQTAHQAGGPWIGSFQEDPSGCLYYSLAHSLPLVDRASEQPDRHLFFQISLADDGMAATHNTEPLLHIGRWDHAINFAQDYYMGFPLFEDGELAPALVRDVLMHWPGGEWLYSVQLSSINTPDDIRSHIIEPVKALLLGTPEHNAPPAALRGLARYTRDEANTGQFHTFFCS
ncbi:hypothetical protein SAMN04487857_111193 [Pseudomonas sp. ok272]|uniref:hypothetical protein n=1 Tax=unclassified Pseudomonas TaxID=196821 RepID=UPI0008CF6BF5|nr:MULTISPECIES: hypothetical protein [unclassified Pseudomonas]SEN20773.1 hypothetical protein SAMN04487857_111193 [Pseudomonas sp. ok272]SFN12672.1 hypothetical protein SAMN04487858_112193 [Pseudomonas sp. ok602]